MNYASRHFDFLCHVETYYRRRIKNLKSIDKVSFMFLIYFINDTQDIFGWFPNCPGILKFTVKILNASKLKHTKFWFLVGKHVGIIAIA